MARILVADNDDGLRQSIINALKAEDESWEAVPAADEHEALAALRDARDQDRPFDVVLTDLKMAAPDGGMQLLEQARALDPSLIVILFTGLQAEDVDRRRAFQLGAFDVVYKGMKRISLSEELAFKTRSALHMRDSVAHLNTLKRYSDPRVFDLLRDKSFSRLRSRPVTVNFWDVRGFTELCEALKDRPDRIGEFLCDYCDAAANVIFRHHGILDKFIGDGVMALFGLLEPQPADRGVGDAVRAAIDLRKEFATVVARHVKLWQKDYFDPPTAGLGCGVNTGDALVGNVGTQRRDQFTALGRTVNFAARMQGQAAAGEILISGTTRSELADSFPAVEREIGVKGFSKKITVYVV